MGFIEEQTGGKLVLRDYFVTWKGMLTFLAIMATFRLRNKHEYDSCAYFSISDNIYFQTNQPRLNVIYAFTEILDICYNSFHTWGAALKSA